MENYSFWADLLHTFRMMSDAVKVLLIYMPCIFSLGLAALYMHHRRQRIRAERKLPMPYTILPPDRNLRQDIVHPSLETLRKLDEYIAEMEVPRDVTRG